MSSIPPGQRAWSKLEAADHAENIRERIEKELLESFGYSPKLIKAETARRTAYIKNAEERATASKELEAAFENYSKWMIETHRGKTEDICCEICRHIRQANSVWPTYWFEFRDRRGEWNQALKACNALQDELQHMAKSIYADKNKFTDIVRDLKHLTNKIKKVRQSDNRFIPSLKD